VSAAPPLLCAALEIALNRYLALEPEVAARCAQLKGRTIALGVKGSDWEFTILPQDSRVQVLDRPEKPADVRVVAPPALLLRQALASGRGERAILDGVQVEGDVGLLSRFGEMLLAVGFDPEEWLAGFLCGAAAHRAAQGLGSLADWGRKALSTLALDTAEYLREETRDLVHRADVERWMDEVAEVGEGAARLEARLSRLERDAGARRPA
jgi:ubiquinone biosynthesis accessory factor UbiJ